MEGLRIPVVNVMGVATVVAVALAVVVVVEVIRQVDYRDAPTSIRRARTEFDQTPLLPTLI
jgi:hypothetical protein